MFRSSQSVFKSGSHIRVISQTKSTNFPFASFFSTTGHIKPTNPLNTLSKETSDVLIAGCGIAGCAAALKLAERGFKVAVLSASENRNNSNSFWAQGGIIYDKGSPSVLVEDIMVAGAGRSDPSAAFELAKEGPDAIEELLFQQSQVEFDRNHKGKLDLCLEAAHSVPRIIHNKDQTGKAIMEAMTRTVFDHPNIQLVTNVTAVDLITYNSECFGAYVLDNETNDIYPIHANETILATGGLGDVFEHTSNPEGSRGDGIAIAARAGAKLDNMEYVQFHPTSLYIPNQNRFLLTEALRGEGAELLTADTKKPFMKKYHDLGTLAPRDIVSRSVFSEMERTKSDHVWLDISHKPTEWIHQRFPAISTKCKSHGFDLATGPVPIVPCAHYSCGGIMVNNTGRTSLQGLRAIGEVSCTGLHGGNRLASTSLVEGLVWGRNAALDILNEKPRSSQSLIVPEHKINNEEPKVHSQIINTAKSQLKKIMWEDVGIVRNYEGLNKASQELSKLRNKWDTIYSQSSLTPDLVGLRNAIHVGQVINQAALRNKKSVGAHYRSDALLTPKKKSNSSTTFIPAIKSTCNTLGNKNFLGVQGSGKLAKSSAMFHKSAIPSRRKFSTRVQKPFPSLTIRADSLIPQGAFAEAQAMFLQPDKGDVLKLTKLLKEKNVGIVAHFYMDPEIQGILNACEWPHIKIADSLLMGDYAVKMAEEGVDNILVLGVDFMSENVQAILRANGHNTQVFRCTQKSIGCSLAESAEGLNYAAYITQASKVPNALHVIYINTSLLTKANSHSLVPTITCTSSNVVQTVLQAYAQIPNCHVFFGPDTYMGENLKQTFNYMATYMTNDEISSIHPAHNQDTIKALLSRFDYFQQGICVVHHMFGDQVVKRVRSQYPDACHTAHFEVPGEMFQLALEAQQKGQGVVGSTSGILDFIENKVKNAKKDSKLKFVLGTEAGMITPVVQAVQKVLSAKNGDSTEAEIIFPVSDEAVASDSEFGIVPGVASGEGCSVSGGCATCPFMKMNSLNAMFDLLEEIEGNSSQLSGYFPKIYNETVNGTSAFELGTLPIQHMRDYGKKKCFGNALLQDVVSRASAMEIGTKKKAHAI